MPPALALATLWLVDPVPPPDASPDQLMAAAIRFVDAAERLAEDPAKGTEAVQMLRNATLCARRVPDDLWTGLCLGRTGMLLNNLGKRRQAIHYLTTSLRYFDRVGAREERALIYVYLGTVYLRIRVPSNLFEYLKLVGNVLDTASTAPDWVKPIADAYFSLAADVTKDVKDPNIRASAHTSAAFAYFLSGQYEKSLASSDAAQRMWNGKRAQQVEPPPVAGGDLRSQALRRLGWTSISALIRTLTDDPDGRVSPGLILFSRGVGITLRRRDHHWRGLGISSLERALTFWRSAGETDWQARTLLTLAMAHFKAGDRARAISRAEEAIALWKRLKEPVELDIARLALEVLRSGVYGRPVSDELRERAELLLGEVRAETDFELLSALARVERGLGRAAVSRQHIDSLLAGLESIKGGIVAPEHRSAFSAAAHDYYELGIDLQLASGDAEAAFLTSEKSRASSIIDAVRLAGVEQDATERELIAEKRRWIDVFVAKQRCLREAYMLGDSQERCDSLRGELQSIRAEINGLEARIRTNGRFWSWLGSTDVDLKTIRDRLPIDDNTLLVAYSLGDDGSVMWLLDRNDLTPHRIGPRARIERKTIGFYKALSTGQQVGRLASELAKELLKPIVSRSEKRLFIVADGALQLIPFAVLPRPAATEPARRGGQRLGETHSVVHLPSASFVALQHARPVPDEFTKTLALVVDPVYRTSGAGEDEHHSAVSPAVPARLPFSAYTAEACVRLLPDKEILIAQRFDSTKELLVSPASLSSRILHIAAHGTASLSQPDLSALRLSRYGSDRQPVTDDSLTLREIYDLDVGSGLVVLAACETLLGRNVPGEGMISIATGFLCAGARCVLGSLWKVDDRATALLLARFYENLFGKANGSNMPPDDALREAQSWLQSLTEDDVTDLLTKRGFKLKHGAGRGVRKGRAVKKPARADRPFAHPYYWSGFVFLGDPAWPKKVRLAAR